MATTDVHDEWDQDAGTAPAALRVLLYSSHAGTREAVRLAVGRRVARDLPPIEWVEVATAEVAISTVDAGGLDLLILDGEAAKNGGMGLCRQLKDEIFRCPPVLLLIGRPQDAWLASWTGADAVVSRPLDPIVVQDAVAGVLRGSHAV
ncbi:hypothetical protein [Actinotalea sp. Marseille-Q4924]|uniref:hypothetical protein n=1 Tax=Actinotalea sp. Marseille-Q4924 TaxID=2866571 RepID=UPI001CE4B56C|nr:hypothetical protein [Actinotalea sp. Marseille-Q4924]